MANYSFTFKDDSLEHHGIDGQKWGVRNGPPYPLAAGDHSAAEKRAMKKDQKNAYKITKKTYYRTGSNYAVSKNKKLNRKFEDIFSEFEKQNSSMDDLRKYFPQIASEVLGEYSNKKVYAKVKIPGEYNGKAYAGTAKDILVRALDWYVYDKYIDPVH